MKRRQKRKVVLLVVLLLLLALVGLWYANFLATKSVAVDLRAVPADTLAAPQYLYAFSGSGADRVQQPIGVLADSGSVYVSDAKAGVILQFRENGTFVRSFGKGKLQTPLYLAKNPKDGNIYVADRRERKVLIFRPTGEYVGVFDPKLPKAQLPTFDAKGDKWVPVALDFAPDGTLYVVELLNGHRLLIFGPDGAFKRSVGHAGVAAQTNASPESFQFPNSVKVHGAEVWVSDSNNRRIQIFSLAGDFKRIVAVSGLPRGIAFLPRPSDATSVTADKFVVIDTLSHDATIFAVDGQKVVSFGSRGVLEGQFSYPNDISVGTNSLMFVTDTNNTRVQVWGWPQKLSPIPRILPQQPAWCLGLLPLLLIPLFFRKKKFFATADFIEAALDEGVVSRLPDRRRSWLVSEADYEVLRDRSQDGIRLADLLTATEYSETDASALEARMSIDRTLAAALVSAQRTKLLCTQDPELRKMARILEIDVVDLSEFLERFPAQVNKNKD